MTDFESCISIASLPTSHAHNRPNYISCDFRFPTTVDTERLVVDPVSLRRLQKIGGFSSTHLTQQTSQPDKRSFGTICDPYDTDPSLLASHGYTQNIVNLNQEAIRKNVEERQQWENLAFESDRPEVAYWASELSAACAESFRDSGRTHLLQRPTLHDAFFDTAIASVISGYNIFGLAVDITLQNSSTNPLAHPVELVGSGLYAVMAVGEALRVKNARGGPLFKDKRWSLLPAFRQPDRYAALATASLFTSVVKVRP